MGKKLQVWRDATLVIDDASVWWKGVMMWYYVGVCVCVCSEKGWREREDCVYMGWDGRIAYVCRCCRLMHEQHGRDERRLLAAAGLRQARRG